MKQEAPFSVQVEATEGCNLDCSFCGINAIRPDGKGGPFKFMTSKTSMLLAEQLEMAGWNPRLEFGMHGEPTMNPDLEQIVFNLKVSLPSSYALLYTNGGGLFGKGGPVAKVGRLFEAGFNTIMIEGYEHSNLSERLRKLDYGYEKLEYPGDKDNNPQSRHKGRKLVFVEDISKASQGTHSSLNNHGGSAGPPEDKLRGQRCAKPFREISVRWNGKIAICCNDWLGEYKCGDIRSSSIEAIWQGLPFKSARAKLYHGQRDFGPCDGCTQRSYRVGLLPDKMGKGSVPKPTKRDQQIINSCLHGVPYTPGFKPMAGKI